MNPVRQRGFSLLELAVVILIVGILLGGALQPLRAGFEQARRARVEVEIGRIRGALLGYAASQSRPHLPCADCREPGCARGANRANDGLQDRDPDSGACEAGARIGNLPWATLGLNASDPWGGVYSYRVAPLYADARSGFDLHTKRHGSAQILTRDGEGRQRTLASHIPVLFFSHGPNQAGAVNPQGVPRQAPPAGSDEAENLDHDRMFFGSAPRAAAASGTTAGFDDISAWIGAYELKYQMLRAGRLP